MFEQGLGAASDGVSDGRMLGLCFDPDRLIVEGVYNDEVTAYRARKRWIKALEHNFLLDDSDDFTLKVRRVAGGKYYRVQCDFISACGRYAFWRLTHHQAPEVQLILETAHLPDYRTAPIHDWLDDNEDECLVALRGTSESREDHDLLLAQSAGAGAGRRALQIIQDLAQKIFSLTRPSGKS